MRRGKTPNVRGMISLMMIVSAAFLMGACTTTLKVSELNNAGYFGSGNKSRVVSSMPVDLDEHKDLIVTLTSDFMVGQLANVGYFDEVLTFEELQKRLIRADLADKVPSVSDAVGVNNAAKQYKPFLMLRINYRGEGPGGRYAQLILTDALTMDDYFVTETYFDQTPRGRLNDQHNWYPMFNSLIDYIKENSKTYQE